MLTLPKIDRNRLPVAANDQMLPTTPPSLEDIDLANDDRIFSNLNLNWCPIRTHSAIQQMYASQDAIDKSASSSQDSKFIYYYPDLDKLRMHVSKIEDSKLEIERDKILKSISPLEPVLEGTESSVVKKNLHEKIRNAQPAVRSGTGGHKATPMPQRKMSRKRLRKVTPSSYNPENVCAHGCELLSANDASTMDANANERSPASSRFRVTRIADSSSWWIPESSGITKRYWPVYQALQQIMLSAAEILELFGTGLPATCEQRCSHINLFRPHMIRPTNTTKIENK
ncbi:hypothetical protein TcWFU_003462 [Taenia crassiceps]|uniref:Uncharacterized protein n=1 Tax=Taenia crassiceps TaxID=6207 RepID=A0ABR4QPZ9_9CEST